MSRFFSSPRASSPHLEPEKEAGFPRGGHSCDHLNSENIQINAIRPPTRNPGASSLGPSSLNLSVTDPDNLRLRRLPDFVRLTDSLAHSLCLRQMVLCCGVTLRRRLAPRDSFFAITGGCRALRARRFAPLTSFSGQYLSAALNWVGHLQWPFISADTHVC